MSSRSTAGRGSPTTALMETIDHPPALPPTKVKSRGFTATPLLGSAPVDVFQPLRAATTPPAAAVPVRNALRVRSVSDRGLLPAEPSRSSITAHLLFLPPNDTAQQRRGPSELRV